MYYFDHCASTPPYDEVIDTISQVMKQYYANPSSLHHLGVEAERVLNKAREVIAKALYMEPQEIIFTSGGTESNNLAIKGAALKYQNRGKHLITTQIEHPSVLESFRQLEGNGFDVTYLRVNEKGKISVNDLIAEIRENTILISIMHVNNEVGSIQPIEEIGSILKSYPRIIYHVDAIQSIGKLPIFPSAWGIDLMSVSAHKQRGPKGAGLLYCRKGLELQSIFSGGGQEQGRRSGTENIPLIAGMAKSIRMTLQCSHENTLYLYDLKKQMMNFLDEIPGITWNGSRITEEMAPHILNYSVPGLKAEVVVHALENHGIMISTRSACSSGKDSPSHVLKAMGYSHDRCTSGLRISLSAMHTLDDINYFTTHFKEVVHQLRSVHR